MAVKSSQRSSNWTVDDMVMLLLACYLLPVNVFNAAIIEIKPIEELLLPLEKKMCSLFIFSSSAHYALLLYSHNITNKARALSNDKKV